MAELLAAFLTPPAATRPPAERAFLALADAATTLPNGAAAWSWGAGPPVLLVHGWGGRGAQLAPLVSAVVDRGRRAVVFDAPAHGDTPGARVTLDDFAETIRAAATWAGPLDALVAHSFGGAAATVALHRGVAARRVAFVAPLFRVAAAVTQLVVDRRLDAASTAAFLAGVAAANRGWSPAELDPPRLAPSLAARLLVVHDRGDREVPFADGELAVRRWPGAALVTTVGLGHQRILADPHVVALVSDFVSGRDVTSFVLDDAARIERELADRELRWRCTA